MQLKPLLTAILFIICVQKSVSDSDETVLYYYGLEESEHNLAECSPRQACGAVARRPWQPRALLRLCRCKRWRRCAVPASREATVPINGRLDLQFCESINNWPSCSIDQTALTVNTTFDNMDPDEIDDMHAKNIQLVPPKIVFQCRCQEPSHWKRKSNEGATIQEYGCAPMFLCKTDDVCGNVSYDMVALYQSCLCPWRHDCLHSGGLANVDISELLFRGRGWRARCQRRDDFYDYE